MKKFALTVTLLGLWAIKSAHAAEFFCSADPSGSGDVSCLIASINDANQTSEEDTINLAAGTYTLTSIDNSPGLPSSHNGLPRIVSAMIINGESAETTIIERDPGAPLFRIFDVTDSGKLILNGLTMREGFSVSGGAGIQNAGTLTVNDSIIERNLTFSSGAGILNTGILTISGTIPTENGGGVFGGGGIFNSGVASIMSSSITHNASAAGGGLLNSGSESQLLPRGPGIVTIRNSTISDNRGESGVGVDNRGDMTITNSTIANNFGRFFFPGAGISSRGMLTVTNSTIAGNIASSGNIPGTGRPVEGGGIAVFEPSLVKLQNTILALNSGTDCLGSLTSLGNNIIGDLSSCDVNLLSSDLTGDPGLGAFVNDVMPGRGHFPLNSDSQAIDAGNPGACLQADQLGLLRIGICDIGAVEFRGPMLVSVDVRPRSEANRINPNSIRNINVAIFSVNGFDATTIDSSTVRFGATGTEAVPINVALRDVDGDGDRDMVVRFQIQDTGIKCGDTSAILTGQISNGPSIIGSSPIRTVQC
jgi:Right handed beta helix region